MTLHPVFICKLTMETEIDLFIEFSKWWQCQKTYSYSRKLFNDEFFWRDLFLYYWQSPCQKLFLSTNLSFPTTILSGQGAAEYFEFTGFKRTQKKNELQTIQLNDDGNHFLQNYWLTFQNRWTISCFSFLIQTISLSQAFLKF